jgi:hypothetical protein
MKKALLCVIALVLVTAAGPSGLARQRKTAQAKAAPDAEFKALIDRYYDAWSKLSTDAPALDLECRHTAIWEKRGAKWLIVHEHVSAPLQG